MAGSDGRINFLVGFTTDEASLSKLRSSLLSLRNLKMTDFGGDRDNLRLVQDEAKKVEKALEAAFNPKLNSFNTQTFLNELKQAGSSIDQVYQKFSMAGVQGQVAFSKMSSAILTTNLQLKQTDSLINKFGTSLINAFKWSIASSAIKTLTTGIQSAFQYTEALLRSLTNIRIVTGDSTEKMSQFADQANRAATELGRSTLDYTKASLTFYQQGLSDEDVQARTEATLKAQNITGAGTLMADYLTSVWNGYKVANLLAELYVDKLAAVADSSASDMSLLAIAMSKVASTANNMGVSVDQLNAQIATVVATTRQAPESVGTAFKTIYTRLNDIKTGADDAEVSLGNYSGQMATLGINVLDQNNNLRDTGLIMEEIGGKWQNLTKEQQIYLARTMGGQRQVNQLIALFDNWTTYSNLLNTSLLSQGTLAEKNARYMESLGAKMLQLGAAGERVKRALINADDMKGLVGMLGSATNLIANFFESFGNGTNVLLAFGGIFTQMFSGIIGKEINNLVVNMQAAKLNAIEMQRDINQTLEYAAKNSYNVDAVKLMVAAKQQLHQVWDVMSADLIGAFNQQIQELGAAKDALAIARNTLEAFDKLKLHAQLAGKAITDIENTTRNMSFKGIESGSQEMRDIYDDLLKKALELQLAVGGPGASVAVDGLVKKYKELDLTLRGSSVVASNFRQELRGVSNLVGLLLTTNRNDLLFNLDQSSKAAQRLKDDLQKAILAKLQLATTQNLVALIGAFGQLAGSLRSIINLPNIWKNENLSGGEKVLQTVTSLSFAIPSLIRVYETLSKSIGIATMATAKKIAMDNVEIATIRLKAAQEKLAALERITIYSDAGQQAILLMAIENAKKNVELAEIGVQNALAASIEATSKAMWEFTASILANPIFIGAVAIGASIFLLDKFTLSTKEAAEAIKKSSLEYEEHKKKLEDVQKLYDELKKKKLELENLGSNISISLELELSAATAKLEVLKDQVEELKRITEEKRKQLELDTKNKIGNGFNQADAYNFDKNIYSSFVEAGGNTYTHLINTNDQQGVVTESDQAITRAFAEKLGLNGMEEIYNLNSVLDYSKIVAATDKAILIANQEGASQIDKIVAERWKKVKENAESTLKEIAPLLRQDIQNLSGDRQSEEYQKVNTAFQNYLISTDKDKLAVASVISNNIISLDTIKKVEKHGLGIKKAIANMSEPLTLQKEGAIIKFLFGLDEEKFNTYLKERGMTLSTWLGGFFKTTKELRRKELEEALQKNQENIKQQKFSDLSSIYQTGSKLVEGKTPGVKLLAAYQNVIEGLRDTGLAAEEDINLLLQTNLAHTQEYLEAFKRVTENFGKLFAEKLNSVDGDVTIALDQEIIKEEDLNIAEAYFDTIEKVNKANLEGQAYQILFNSALQKLLDILKIDKKAFDEYTKTLKESDKVKKKADETEEEYNRRLQEVALNTYKFNDALDVLSKNYKNWSLIVNSEKDIPLKTPEYALAMSGLKQSMKDMFDIDLSDDEIIKYLELIGKTAKGSEEALILLQRQLALEEINKIEIPIDAPKPENFDDILNQVNDYIANMSPDDIKTRAWCQTDIFVLQLKALISSAVLTAEQINNILGNIGGKIRFKGDFSVIYSKLQSVINTGNKVGGWFGQVGAAPAKAMINELVGGIEFEPNNMPTVKSPGGGSGGGGGGGGGGAEKDPKKELLIKDERDAYYEINKLLSKLETLYKHVSDAQKKAFGQGAIDLLDELNDLIDKQIDKYEEKIKLIDELNAKLQKAAADANYEAVFDPNTGELTNYSELYESELKKVNDVIEKYNKVGELQGFLAQKLLDQELKDAKQRWEDFKDWLSKFDANVELKKETILSIRQQLEEKIELNIEKFKVKIDLDLDLAEAQREWNEFKKKVIDKVWKDDVIKNTKATLLNLGSYYDGEGGGAIPALTEHVNATLEEIEKLRNEEDGVYGIFNAAGGISSSNLKQALEDLKDYSQKLMENLEAVEDLLDLVKQAFFDMIDAAQKAFDEQNKEYDYLSKLLDHNKSVILMLYGDRAFDKLDKYNKQQIENDKRQMDFNKLQKDFWYSQMLAEKARMATLDKESNAYKESEERFKILQEHWMSSLETFNLGLENSIQHIVDRYNNTIDSIVDKLDKKLSGSGLGIDYDKEEWERINKMAERYLNPVQRLIDLQDIDDTFKDALKNAEGNIKAQKSLQNIYNTQLKILKDKDKLSKYDVDRANLLIELETKKIALEQSRQNTSKLRLRRDSQGNYTYQYVADLTTIQEAEKEVRDLYGQLTDLNIDRFNEIKQEFPEATKQYLEDLAEYKKDANLSPELRQKKISDLNNYYNLNYKGLADAYQTVRKNLELDIPNAMSYLQGYHKDFFQNMAQDEKNAFMESIIPTWNSNIDDMINKINGLGGLELATKDSFNEIDAATKLYLTSLGELEKAADVSFKAIAEGLDLNIPKTKELIEDNGTLIGTYEDEATAMREVLKLVEALTEGFREQKEAAIAAAEAARLMYDELARTQTERLDLDYDLDDEDNSDANTIESWGKKSSTDQGWRSYKLLGDSESQGQRWKYLDENGKPLTGTHTLPYEGKMAEYTFDGNGELLASELHPTHDGWYGASNLRDATEEEKKKYGMATGGYTGSWGSDAKLAFLHQKELVLNEDDTENMLKTVDIVRAMKDELDMLQNNVYESLFSLNPYNNNGFPNDSVLEQNVHITATFPNVNSSKEIEDAFNNLVNRASQYAYRSKVI